MESKIINGDCVEKMKELEAESIDLVITSPPYDNLRNYKGYSFDFENVVKELYRILKQGGVVVWIVNDSTIDGSETGTSFKQALYFKEIGFNLHDTMIWMRRTVPQNSNRYESAFEYMFVFSKGKPNTFNPIKSPRIYNDKRKRKNFHRDTEGNFLRSDFSQKDYVTIGNVWDIPNRGHDEEAYEHPAVFPELLVEYHIKSWSKENDWVLDPFVGSGTTCKVALKNCRNCIGIDISKEYCELAEKRIKPFKEQLRLQCVKEKENGNGN